MCRANLQEFVEQFQFIELSAAQMADKRAATEAIIASANLQSGAFCSCCLFVGIPLLVLPPLFMS